MKYTLTDGIVDAFCALLKPFVHPKERLPGTKRKDGIMVMYNKTDIGLIMFRFVHKEMMEIQLPLELDRLVSEGRDYLHGRIEMLVAQIPTALKEKQEDNALHFYNKPVLPEKSLLGDAMFSNDGDRKQGVLH